MRRGIEVVRGSVQGLRQACAGLNAGADNSDPLAGVQKTLLRVIRSLEEARRLSAPAFRPAHAHHIVWRRQTSHGISRIPSSCLLITALIFVLALTAAGCGVSIKPAPASSSGKVSATAGSAFATPSATASTDPVATSVVDASPKANTPAAKARSAKPSPTSTPSPTPTAGAGQTALATHPAGQPTDTSTVAPANSQAPQPPAAGGGQSNSVPTPTPAPESQPTAPPAKPEPTPTATAPGLPGCQTQPVRGFGLAWHDYPALANAVGCPLGPEIGLPSMVQSYQHGLMIWLDLQANASTIDSQSWVVALGGSTANRTRFDDGGLTWQLGQVAPSGAFSWVYQNVYTDADRLGAPSSRLSQSDAAIELFEHGTMIWLRNPPGSSNGQPMIYVIEANLVTGASGSFQAVPDKSFQ